MRSYSSLILGCLLAVTVAGMNAAGADTFREGRDYATLSPAQPTVTDGDGVEVTEWFWYGCPHCYRLEPHMDRWLDNKPAAARYVRMPAALNPNWRNHARAFFTAEVLGKADEMHADFYKAIHDEGQRLNDERSLAAFFGEHGVDEATFKETFNSFAVETRLQRANSFAQRYRIDSTPSVVVAGKYRVSAGMAQSFDRMIDIINYLVERESS